MGRLTAIVLGSAAGGGFPQWNCRCPVCRLAWAGDARVRPRSQASLAVSADGKDWVLINASPDLPAQLRRATALHPRTDTRGSPIKAVLLTGAEIDQVAGLLSLREREPFSIFATDATLAALADNPMFAALAPELVARRTAAAGEAADPAGRDCGRAVHGAGQGSALSRRREPRHRERDAVECRGGDFGGQRAHRLCPGGRERHRGDAGAHRACRRGPVRRHALSRRRDDRERDRQQDRPPHGTHADRRRRRLARRAGQDRAAAHLRAHQQHQS